ncbi:MAG TPA: hypothetical protein VGB15_07915 [Longimicrobium sp.]|jgi:hypothetical protein
METKRLDVNALQVTTFEAGRVEIPEVAGTSLGGGTGGCHTCKFTVCQETRAEP